MQNFKGTVYVFLSGLPFKKSNARITMLTNFKPKCLDINDGCISSGWKNDIVDPLHCYSDKTL